MCFCGRSRQHLRPSSPRPQLRVTGLGDMRRRWPPGASAGGTAICDPGLVSLLAHSGHFPHQSPGSSRLPVSPQQLEGTQDHDEIEGLHVEGQSQESQEGERGDGEVKPGRETGSSPRGPRRPRASPAPSRAPSQGAHPPTGAGAGARPAEARGHPAGMQLGSQADVARCHHRVRNAQDRPAPRRSCTF